MGRVDYEVRKGTRQHYSLNNVGILDFFWCLASIGLRLESSLNISKAEGGGQE